MDLRLGLSLLLLFIYFSSTQSKNIRDGPNLRQRHAKRATPSEFLQPPPPIGNIVRNHPPRDLAPPPPPPPPPSSIRTGRFVTDPRPEDVPSRGYFSRLLGWLNPWSSNGGLEPPPQSVSRNPVHQEQPPSSKQNGPFQSDRSCNPCNEVPWIPIRGLVDGPVNHHPQNLNINLRDGYYQQTPSQEIREPHFAYPAQNLYPGPMRGNHPIPNPHIYPGAIPPLYKAEPFGNGGNGPYSGSQGLPGNDFHHRQETNNYGGPLDSGSASTNIQESVQVQGQGIQVQDNQKVPDRENQNQGIQEQSQNQGVQVESIQNQGVPEQSQNQRVPEQSQNQGFQEQRQPQGIQELNQQQGIQQQNQNQGFQQQNQIQEFQQQNQNQGFQQNNQNQGIQQHLNQWVQQQTNQNQGIQQTNQNQGIQQQTNQNQRVQGQAIQKQQNQGYQSEKQQFHSEVVHSEVVPSIGGQISSEQIHFEKSPLIDLTVSSTPSTPVTLSQSFSTPLNSGKTVEASTRPSSLIDYLVSGFDERIPTTGATGTGSIVPTGTETIVSTGTGPILPIGASGTGSSGAETGSVGASGSDVIKQGQVQGRHEGNLGPLGYDEKQPFLEALMESYYNFKKEEAALRDSKENVSNSASSGTSGEDLLLATPISRAAKRHKQVQIIIPYTSQYTPIPFHSSFVDDRNGRVMGHYLPRKVPSGNQVNYFEDNAVAQESRTVAVTSLPDASSSVTPAEKGKNNSIDVQRLQKNIDNWTIQEYSSGMKHSTVLPNATRPYLSHSKKIPDAYFTTKEPNNTSDEIYDFEDYKQMTTFEISKVTQTSTPKTTTTTEAPKIELDSKETTKSSMNTGTKENETETGTGPGTGTGTYSSASENYAWKVYPVFLTTSTVTTVDDVNNNLTAVPTDQKESKKAVEKESKKKPKKKDPEQVERAYQVLPQAVNNLAVASTGPEHVPLWGIMEHEEFASQNSEPELPILYSGHSRVSYSRR